MPYSEHYIPGDRLVVCDICGFEWRFSQMRKGISGNQIGLNIGPDCFDAKHPNENFVLKLKVEGKVEEIR